MFAFVQVAIAVNVVFAGESALCKVFADVQRSVSWLRLGEVYAEIYGHDVAHLLRSLTQERETIEGVTWRCALIILVRCRGVELRSVVSTLQRYVGIGVKASVVGILIIVLKDAGRTHGAIVLLELLAFGPRYFRPPSKTIIILFDKRIVAF